MLILYLEFYRASARITVTCFDVKHDKHLIEIQLNIKHQNRIK